MTRSRITSHVFDPLAKVVELRRRQKKSTCSGCQKTVRAIRSRRVHMVRDLDAARTTIYVAFEYRRVQCQNCQAVKQESLNWLAKSNRFTQRFEDFIGKQCRDMTVKRAAELNRISWDQAWRMDKAYMRKLLEQNPPPRQLRAIGIDEVSVKKGHTYAITVATLEPGAERPIWMGGEGRKEEDMNLFFEAMGPERCRSIELIVMDMWKAFRNAAKTYAPQARIVFDKFHVLGHLSDALDEVRRSEYKRVSEKERQFIKGQRYTLLSHKANLNIEGRRALKMLLKANKRLHKAYLLKESFDQLWAYNNATWARKFFEHWKDQLRWQRLKSFEKFAAMIDRHWDSVVSYCHPDNKVSLGFMEGLNNKIRVIQRRAYGIKDREYLMLKVITSFIKES